jgi:hypothetical protein
MDDLLISVESRSWPQAPGHIDRSFVHVGHGNKRASYAPEISYSYLINGKTYVGHDVMLGRAWNSASAYELVRQFPQDRSVKISYSARNPERALLLPGLHPPSFSLFFLGCTLISFGGTLAAGFTLANRGVRGISGQINFPAGTPASRILWSLLLVTFGSMLATITVPYL